MWVCHKLCKLWSLEVWRLVLSMLRCRFIVLLLCSLGCECGKFVWWLLLNGLCPRVSNFVCLLWSLIVRICIAPLGPKIQRRLRQQRRTKKWVWTDGFSSGVWKWECFRTVECQQVESSRWMEQQRKKRDGPIAVPSTWNSLPADIILTVRNRIALDVFYWWR